MVEEALTTKRVTDVEELSLADNGMVYTLDDVPKPFSTALGLGLQHVLTMFGATISVPLLLAPALGMSGTQLAILVASAMLCSGVATFIQVNFGTRLPIIQGVSFSFLGPFFAIIAATAGGAVSMQYIAGAIILGALVEMFIGFSGLIGKLQKFISPVVIGPTIALIGLALYESGAPIAGNNWFLAGIVIVGVFLFNFVLGKNKNLFSLFPVLLSVIAAYVVALVLTYTGVFGPESAGYVSFETLQASPWFRTPGQIFMPWGAPKFSLSFFLVVLAGYLASTIESYGDYQAMNKVCQGPELTPQRVSNGIGCEGLGCLITGLLGGFASTSYTENIGLVGLTKVASRYVVNIGVVVLILLGIIGKFGGFIASIPMPIVGGLYITMFGLIAAIGLSHTAKADMSSQRNLMIIGFSLFMGLSLPTYFSAHPLVFESAPWLSDIINSIGGTGMAVGAICGLILDNLIPGTDQERGLEAEGEAA
ncbi:solute carrier family 23 protein [Halocella sp. SP3-1]|uniref:uracil-xanthine permease family protein n=1 Tax=Halocella sp. SP3-1 TaxID=2382161 RepID=UPI000F759D01|nr:solute carrier family 23 protein [Halocella sp. SP3-1]AZO94846.1 xanthine permease [Halocella sp. SP3-1]